MTNSLACHILIYVYLRSRNLNGHAKPKKTQANTRYNWHLNPSPTGYITYTSIKPVSLGNKFLQNQ